MRIFRIALGAAALAGAYATACTAYVAATLNGLDDFSQDGALTPGENTDKCALYAGQDAAGNDCITCLSQNCNDDVQYACNGGSNPKNWFEKLRSCAQNPYESNGGAISWRCYPYDDPDAEAIAGSDDSARERQSELCVRDKCLAGGNRAPAPCHECVVSVDKPGSSGETAFLEDSPCGKCISDHCKAPIARCCGSQLPSGLAKCGYPQDSTFKAACQAVLSVQPGPGAQDAGCDANEQCISDDCSIGSVGHCTLPEQGAQCDFDVRSCAKQNCESQCQ